MTFVPHEAEPVTAIERLARGCKFVWRQCQRLEQLRFLLGGVDDAYTANSRWEPWARRCYAPELVR
jgi:hypothetical protein